MSKTQNTVIAGRQGDLFLAKSELPKGEPTRIEKPVGNRLILLLGEATGHNHSVLAEGIAIKWFGDIRMLVADREFVIEHQEHAPLTFPAGTYALPGQYEFIEEEQRPVYD